jgi:hypothetical protein
MKPRELASSGTRSMSKATASIRTVGDDETGLEEAFSTTHRIELVDVENEQPRPCEHPSSRFETVWKIARVNAMSTPLHAIDRRAICVPQYGTGRTILHSQSGQTA